MCGIAVGADLIEHIAFQHENLYKISFFHPLPLTFTMNFQLGGQICIQDDFYPVLYDAPVTMKL